MTEFEALVLKKLDALSADIGRVDGRLTQHMDDEEGEIAAVGKRIDQLAMSMNAYATNTETMLQDMSKAFLEHEDDKHQRDYAGHYTDHKHRKVWSDKIGRWRDDAIGHIVKTGAFALVMWFLYEIWRHLLEGPPK